MSEEVSLIIRVGSKTDPQKLASSIVAAWREGKDIQISVIGPFPINQAFKGVCIANKSLASQGVMLGIIPGIENRQILDKPTGQMQSWVVCTMRLTNLIGANNGRNSSQVQESKGPSI